MKTLLKAAAYTCIHGLQKLKKRAKRIDDDKLLEEAMITGGMGKETLSKIKHDLPLEIHFHGKLRESGTLDFAF